MKQDKTIALINEAIRELNISDIPGISKRVKRLARKYIKRQVVEPIDTINWPKGCLAVGLMNYGIKYIGSADPEEVALANKSIIAVQSYLDKWISVGSKVYIVDNCLMGQAILLLVKYLVQTGVSEEVYGKYIDSAKRMMDFLYNHRTDASGCLPYRPKQISTDIYADSIGMMVPFAINYGLLCDDRNAIKMGIRQLLNYMEFGFDRCTGLPYHAYHLNEEGDDSIHSALGWGRSLGWIAYGVGACDIASLRAKDSYIADEVISIRKQVLDTAEKYINKGLWGSNLLDENSPIDTSASAMILSTYYKPEEYADKSLLDSCLDTLIQYITEDGRVVQAQGECIGLGFYSDKYDSYPWSVGMTLALM